MIYKFVNILMQQHVVSWQSSLIFFFLVTERVVGTGAGVHSGGDLGGLSHTSGLLVGLGLGVGSRVVRRSRVVRLGLS